MRRCHVSFQIRDHDSFHATVTSMVVLLSLLRYVNGPDWTDFPSQTGNLTGIHVLIVSKNQSGGSGCPLQAQARTGPTLRSPRTHSLVIGSRKESARICADSKVDGSPSNFKQTLRSLPRFNTIQHA